ncbi:Protein of unknown function [Lactobacillus helveticus CIRM-BIA 953]|uniref:Uncharacterized protein n=1 Tax=Lactobacillus helveticus CIRM-BIA 953 TaxID=1226335 RepID=U4QBM0_LACHE|nr:Protein of unknown function [Lactobacillus helveticus CIRM-BIA 953]
MEKKREPLY